MGSRHQDVGLSCLKIDEPDIGGSVASVQYWQSVPPIACSDCGGNKLPVGALFTHFVPDQKRRSR
eukprot:527791-Pelagomonas_calceolata.AAC.6